ncbi:Endonuclease/exonuclease/phosphatase [Aspergillus egyptiacus]|nr:Endonuclease/exonuclease/phosphatase [Aspergillus egyptiacus]
MKPTTLLPLVSPSLAALTGNLSILAYNVAGLPAIINDNGVPGDKAINHAIIGERFNQYDWDIIQVQEDFNYHAKLYATNSHPHRTATSGGVPFGSGLNTVANYPWIDFERTKWDECAIGSGDCLTPKGFTVMRVRLDEGVYVDCYNLHADAGSTPDDRAVRTTNLQQVADKIASFSAGNAVMVFGDFNARYTTEDENIRVFRTQEGMTDPWVELIRGGVEPEAGTQDVPDCGNPTDTMQCEEVDKIFYRGSRALSLKATEFAYASDKFLNGDDILSDHLPVEAFFDWERSNTFRQSDLFGGPHGAWFNDLPTLPSSDAKITKIALRAGNRLDGIELTLSTGQIYTHGGIGGQVLQIDLAEDEFWTYTRLCRGKHNGSTRVFYMAVETSGGNRLAVGTETEDCVEMVAEDGWAVLGLWGRDGDEIDRLGVIYGKQY